MEEKAAVQLTPWEALPGLELYMDQVLIVLNGALEPLMPQEGPAVTATMINNYVKMKLAAPAEKKKYNRDHMARFLMICLLKKVLSMQEITTILNILLKNCALEEAYGLFRRQLEQCLATPYGPDIPDCPPALAAAIRAVACKLQVERLLGNTAP